MIFKVVGDICHTIYESHVKYIGELSEMACSNYLGLKSSGSRELVDLFGRVFPCRLEKFVCKICFISS